MVPASRSRLARHTAPFALWVALAAVPFLAWVPRAHAEAESAEVEVLRAEVADLKRRDEANQARMLEMEKMLRELLEAQRGAAAVEASAAPAASPKSAPATAPADALDAALATTPSTTTAAVPGSSTDVWSARIGQTGAQARLMDISLTMNAAAGGSTANDDELGDLQGGAHDPLENGFTLQQAELALGGAVDPYFTGFANIVFTPNFIELEEAFLTTSSLPFGLQVEGGYFLTEFGLNNPTHAHAWYWMDQPVVNTRLFGGEGLRSVGARVGWLLPLPFFSELHVGVQDAGLSEYTQSFLGEEGIGGRPNVDRNVDSFGEMLWLGRWNAAWDLSDTSALLVGASVLYGPNATGQNGETWIYGGDVKLRWRDPNNFRGWPFVAWQTEVIARDYTADWFLAGSESDGDDDGHGHDHGGEEEEEVEFPNDLPADTLHDVGFYSQLLYGFRFQWAAGLRAEYVTGSGASVAEGVLAPRSGDPMRADRLRLSPLLVWHPTEFSRLRLQYNFDDSDSLRKGQAHTVWVGAEVLYGTHGAHKY